MKPSGRLPAAKIKPNTLAEVIRTYLASDKFKRLAPSTQTGYRIYLALAERPDTLGAMEVIEVRPSVVQRFLDGLAHKPGAQARARVALKAMSKWAVTRDLLPFPITYGVEVVGDEGHHIPWSDDQVAIAVEHARPEISRLVTLQSCTGQRGSDLVKMRWSEIETVQGTPGIHVKQQKTGLKLWVPFLPELQDALAKWERAPGFILLRENGQPWTRPRLMSYAWTRERNKNPHLRAHRGLVLHGLRGHAVVRLRRAGLSALQVADMVGMSVQMIERYCALANQQQSAIAAVHFLDRHRATSLFGKSRSDAS